MTAIRRLQSAWADDGTPVTLTILHTEGWSALFADDENLIAGDTYLIWEHLAAMLGATEESVEPTELLFPEHLGRRETGTLAAVRARQAAWAQRQAEAAELDEQAAEFRRRAAALRGQKGS